MPSGRKSAAEQVVKTDWKFVNKMLRHRVRKSTLEYHVHYKDTDAIEIRWVDNHSRITGALSTHVDQYLSNHHIY